MIRDCAERFWEKVEKSDGCWLWSAATSSNGYGLFGVARGTLRRAHRVAYELVNGPISDGLFVCHRCDNRKCVRPDHLFLGTNTDNVRDMRAKGRQNDSRPTSEFCKRGHRFSYHNGSQQICRECQKVWARQRAERGKHDRR